MRFLSVNLDCFLIEFQSLEETMAAYDCLKQAISSSYTRAHSCRA